MSDDYLTMVVHGESKAGKTTLAATAPGPILVMDAEAGGMRFVPGKKIVWEPSRGAPPKGYDIYQVPVKSLADIEGAYQYLTMNDHPFVSIIFDSLTEIQARMKRDHENNGIVDMQGWGRMLAKMEDLIWQFRDLAESSVTPVRFVAFLTGTNLKDGKYRPLMQGAIVKQLPYKVDICAFLDVINDANGTPIRGLRVSGSEMHDIGSRVPGLDPTLWNPNITDLLNTIFGSEEQQKDK